MLSNLSSILNFDQLVLMLPVGEDQQVRNAGLKHKGDWLCSHARCPTAFGVVASGLPHGSKPPTVGPLRWIIESCHYLLSRISCCNIQKMADISSKKIVIAYLGPQSSYTHQVGFRSPLPTKRPHVWSDIK